MKVVSLTCEDLIAYDVFDYFRDNYTDNSIFTMLKNLMPKFEDTMVFCKLFGNWTTCENLLFPIVTEEGLCYAFNAFSSDEMLTNE